jgi:predicted Zn-dependent peptidase
MNRASPIVCLLWLGALARGAEFDPLAQATQTFSLPNGMRVLVLERVGSPIIAAQLRLGAGHAQNPAGKRGLAAMLEPMYFRGPEAFGSADLAAEKEALAKADQLLDERDAELARGAQANLLTAQSYKLKARVALEASRRLSPPSFPRKVFEANNISDARVEVNAGWTDISALLPANRAEVWFKLTGEWLRRPSFRGFYDDCEGLERLVDQQSRQMITVKLSAALLPVAFPNHPYAKLVPAAEEVGRLRTNDMRQFWQRYVTGGNLSLALVGDVSLSAARRWAETYFGAIPAGAAPAGEAAAAFVPNEPQRIEILDDDEAVFVMAWPRPPRSHGDDAALELLAALIEQPGSPFERALAEGDRLTNQLRVAPAWPADQLNSLFVIFAAPAAGRSFTEMENAIGKAVAALRDKPVPETALERARMWLRSQWVKQAETHASLARLLLRSLDYGGPQAFAARGGAINQITPGQLQQAAASYLAPSRAFVVWGGNPRGAPAGEGQ